MRLDGFNFIPGVIFVNSDKVILYPFSATLEGTRGIEFPPLSKSELLRFLENYANSTPEGVYQTLLIDKTFGLTLEEICSYFKLRSPLKGSGKAFRFSGSTDMHVDGASSGNRTCTVQINVKKGFTLMRVKNNVLTMFPLVSKPTEKISWIFGSPVALRRQRVTADKMTSSISVQNGDALITVQRSPFFVPHSVSRGKGSTTFTRMHSGELVR